MQLIDIGANLTHEAFDRDRDAVLQRARAAGRGRSLVGCHCPYPSNVQLDE